MIFHVVAYNSNIFACLEIIGVFNFWTLCLPPPLVPQLLQAAMV